ncbi:ATP-binding protein [Streptomyces sp. NPDC101776]|uniref:ATP-binding protein n=1 Tax=Streptomyces sp. NPDC101776 TaxID=3366146 RepID=UPI00380B4A25
MDIKREVSGQGARPEIAPDEAETVAAPVDGAVARSVSPVSPVSPVPPNAAAARDVIAELLTSRCCGPEGQRPADTAVTDALLVTSELVTNAIRHGGGITEFAAEITDEGLYIAVGDASTRPPVIPDKEETQTMRVGGYGWRLVRRLASKVSVAFHSRGKHITALVPLA